MAITPTNIRALRDQGCLEIQWNDGLVCRPTFVAVRAICPCAGCIEEWTHRPLLDPATIPADITPLAMSMIGSYAIKIHWSDGHDTGLFTWERLRDLCLPPAP